MFGYGHGYPLYNWRLLYYATPYAAPIKNDADPSAQQTIGDEFKAIWKTEIKKSDEEIIPHIRSIVHECFKKEAKEGKQWYSVIMEFIMDKNEFFISQYNQHHEMIKGIFLKLPITSLKCLVAQLDNAKDKATCIKNFLTMEPAIKAACSAAEQALGERFWAAFKQWITDKEILKRLPKPMQQELKEEIEADIEAEQRANWVDSIATFFLPCMSYVKPLRRCQETRPVWLSRVMKLGKSFISDTDTAPLVSIQTDQPIKETRLTIGEKIE